MINIVSCFSIGIYNEKIAQAFEEEIVCIIQNNNVVYNGMNFLSSSGGFINFSEEQETFENALYSSMLFTINGKEIIVDPNKINIDNFTEIKIPKDYYLNINFNYNDKDYNYQNAKFTVNKKILDVAVLLNGVRNLTIKEGEYYLPKIIYVGFVEGDDENNSLTYPATISNEPKRPINNYEIRADGASSDFYEMNYLSSYVTITSNPIEEITYTSGNEDLLIMRGKYSPYCELEYINAGISEASVIYTEISNKMYKYYENTGIFKEYQPIASYRINLKINEQKEELVSSHISIKIDDKLVGYDNYFVIALTNDGIYQVVNTTVSDGYLSFTTSDLGDFVVVTPIKGVNVTQFMIIAFSIFGAISLGIILYSIFRKKY